MSAVLQIRPDGTIRYIYNDALRGLMDQGVSEVKRASDVEPTADGKWTADLTRVGGPVLGPFEKRQDALDAEVAWLENNNFGDKLSKGGNTEG